MTKQEQLATIAKSLADCVIAAQLGLRDGAEVQQTIDAVHKQADEYGLTDSEVLAFYKENYYSPVW